MARNFEMEYFTYELKNGIRLVHMPVESEIAYCGMMIHTGTRDEDVHEHGMAHFIEHMLFKGTQKRKPFHILSRMEDVGGEINAYTTKEETCIYASCLKADYSRAIELISDVLIRSTFPEKEMDREKEVIIDEINSYKDSPGELIFDDFEELIFPDHPIGRNILGSPESVKSFTRQQVEDFMSKNYNTDEMVFCSVGNINFNLLKRYFEKYFSEIPSNFRTKKRIQNLEYNSVNEVVKMDTYQTHYLLGTTAYNALDDRRVGLYLLNNILGGQGLNSRLNMSLREKNGYAYNIESSYNPYFDTGVLSIYFGTDSGNLAKSKRIAYNELKKLRTKKLGIVQLHKAHRQMIGQLARGRESHENLMFSLGKSILLFNQFESTEETNRKIEAVDANELLQVANEMLGQDRLSSLTFK